MSLGFKLFWIITACELLLWLIPSLQWRRVLTPFIMVALLVDSAVILYAHLSVPTIILALMSLYRIGNLARLMKAQIHEQYLRRVSVQTSLWIILMQAGLLIGWLVASRLHITTYHLWLLFVSANVLAVLIILVITTRQLRKTRLIDVGSGVVADRDYPTLTVAIPARNETDDLEACLKSLVSSNYPKLEIVVLDDCSQDKRTPEIIRAFAQEGIRFIQGNPPEDNWLAKNLAYQRLFEESNGELLLFCGVDVRFQTNSLHQIVTTMLHKQKSMMSIIPKNIIDKDSTHRDSILLQPIRYAWELALPRKLFHRPAVLSTCWIIKRDMLENAGGFGAVSRSIIPESYFARVSAIHDGYSFVQSNDAVSITSHKSFNEQYATFIRTRYPQVHRRMELVLVITVFELIGVLMPFILLVIALFGHISAPLIVISIVTAVALMFLYFQVVYVTYHKWFWRSLLLPPIFAVLDAALLNYSMFRYEFSSVFWKGRNICIPIMHISAQPSERRT